TALGKSFQLLDGETRTPSPPIAIVGVVRDVLYRGPRPIAGRLGNGYEIYVPLAQAPGQTLSTAVVTAGDPAALSPALPRELGRLAPTSPLHWISTMEEELGSEVTDSRFHAFLTGGYSLCALLLAALGIYGMLANAVDRRQAELGVRMAAGARGSDI